LKIEKFKDYSPKGGFFLQCFAFFVNLCAEVVIMIGTVISLVALFFFSFGLCRVQEYTHDHGWSQDEKKPVERACSWLALIGWASVGVIIWTHRSALGRFSSWLNALVIILVGGCLAVIFGFLAGLYWDQDKHRNPHRI